jgi:hypothetical protein
MTAIQGSLEIDYDRGVIYFHADTGITLLRISKLPLPMPNKSALTFIDVTASDAGTGYNTKVESPDSMQAKRAAAYAELRRRHAAKS